MIYSQTILAGIDQKIYRMQKSLDEYFANIWSGDIETYGRIIDITNKDNKKKPHVFLDAYKEVFSNDKVAGTVGFFVKKRYLTTPLTADVEIAFTLMLSKIYPGILERYDEKSIMQAKKAIEKTGLIIELNGEIKTGIADVFNGYNTENVKYADMQPWCVFSVGCKINYTEGLC